MGGDFIILGSHIFLSCFFTTFSFPFNIWPWDKTLTKKVRFVYVQYRFHSEHLVKNVDFFRKHRDEKTKQCKITNIFKKSTLSIEDGQLVSYYLSLIIAKQGLPHTIKDKTFIPVFKTVMEKIDSL